MILTNNPLVKERFGFTHEVNLIDTSYEGLLKEARDRIHAGHLLLSHPLSGSVKPNETPYKSILISAKKGRVDPRSLKLIEHAIGLCKAFRNCSEGYSEAVRNDFQLIDCTLIESGIASADEMCG